MNSRQPGVIRLGLLENGDVGVGVFPEGEEILVGSLSVCRPSGQPIQALPKEAGRSFARL